MESSEAISAFDDFRPDLVLLDLRMPGVDVGFEVLSQIGLHTPHQGYLPVVVLTAEQSQAAKQKALLLGAKDIITKPFCNAEVVHRVSTLLETRFLHREIEQQNQMLDQKVRERIRDLENAQIEILH